MSPTPKYRSCVGRPGTPPMPRTAAETALIKLRKIKKGRTPHQGNDRVFGEFQCPQCSRRRQSGYSWADTAQKCKPCNIPVYPHKQRPLKKKKEEDEEDDDFIDLKKPHLEELCGKCKSLGHPCTRRF